MRIPLFSDLFDTLRPLLASPPDARQHELAPAAPRPRAGASSPDSGVSAAAGVAAETRSLAPGARVLVRKPHWWSWLYSDIAGQVGIVQVVDGNLAWIDFPGVPGFPDSVDARWLVRVSDFTLADPIWLALD